MRRAHGPAHGGARFAPKRNRGSRVAGARVREGEVSGQPTEPRLPRATPQSTIIVVVCEHVYGVASFIGESPVSKLTLAPRPRSVKDRVRSPTIECNQILGTLSHFATIAKVVK